MSKNKLPPKVVGDRFLEKPPIITAQGLKIPVHRDLKASFDLRKTTAERNSRMAQKLSSIDVPEPADIPVQGAQL